MKLVDKLPKQSNPDYENLLVKHFISLNLRKIIKRANGYKQLVDELPDNLSTESYRRFNQMISSD